MLNHLDRSMSHSAFIQPPPLSPHTAYEHQTGGYPLPPTQRQNFNHYDDWNSQTCHPEVQWREPDCNVNCQPPRTLAQIRLEQQHDQYAMNTHPDERPFDPWLDADEWLHDDINGFDDDYVDPNPPNRADYDAKVLAVHELLRKIPNRDIENERGITSDDLRAGKYGKLTPGAEKELAMLDKNQNYHLVEHYNDNTASTFWAPQNGGPRIEVTGRSATHDMPDVNTAPLKRIREGINSNDLKSGKYGPLSPDMKSSLDMLENNKNYDLTFVFRKDENDENSMAWVEQASGKTIPIGVDYGYPF